MASNTFSKLSLVITTYNWPDALALVLESVRQQSKLPFEVIIADDGSDVTTKTLIDKLKNSFPCHLKHVWQADNGYQGARIRNLAVKISEGDYLVFIDGDCLLRHDFIRYQHRLAEDGFFVAGNRVLMSDEYTKEVLCDSLHICYQNAFAFSNKQLNRRWALLRPPFGMFRRFFTQEWKGAKSCNLALPKEAFFAVNGFDESFKGWGHEDSDLVIRLIKYGIKRKSGRFAITVLHLHHPTIKSINNNPNWDQLLETLHGSRHLALKGLNQGP